MKGKKLKLSIIMVLIIVLISGCGKKGEVEEDIEENYTPVETSIIKNENLYNNRKFIGRVVANEEVFVIPKVGGKVSHLNVELGDKVSKDQILFTLDQKDFSRNIDQTKTAINQASIGIEQASKNIETAKINYDTALKNKEKTEIDYNRTKELYEEGAVAKSQLEQIEMAYTSSINQLKQAENQITQAEIALKQANNQLNQTQISHNQAVDGLDNTVIKAPISGTLSTLDVKEGQLAGAGQVAATVVDTSKIYIKIDVIEDIVNKIKPGDNVSVKIPAISDEIFNSTISYVSPTADVGNKLYSVKIYLNNDNNLIKQGMTGEVELALDKKENIIVLEKESILNDVNGDYVYILEDNKAVKKEVVVGLVSGDKVEVISGVNIGDELIIKGQHYVDDGSVVKVVGGN